MAELKRVTARRGLPGIAPKFVLVLAAGTAAVFALSSCLPAQINAGDTQQSRPIRLAQAESAAAPYSAHKLCDLQDTRIDESSGLGASRRYPGLFWTHNDSGDTARLFLVDKLGKTLTTVKLNGAGALDWEDMAVAGDKDNSWIYAGDIGDNAEARANVMIYRFREPDIDIANPPAQLNLECEKMTLTYPDKPHNCETLIADDGGFLLLVTKAIGEALVFQTPSSYHAGVTQELKKLGEITMPDGIRGSLTTAGDLAPDGKHLVVMTYTQLHEWTLAGPANTDGPRVQWQEIIDHKPRVWDLPRSKQMEAVCYGLDNHLYTTSEQLPTPFFEYTPVSPAN